MTLSYKKLSATIIMLCVFSMLSCSDPELDRLMDDYCNCIQKARYDQSMRYECIEKMDTIKKKYENQPRKLQSVLEKTDECY
tara:strand:+ start:118291 stop:118536 length:246 start_codon:yes stop_codon:yes gene_type:complete